MQEFYHFSRELRASPSVPEYNFWWWLNEYNFCRYALKDYRKIQLADHLFGSFVGQTYIDFIWYSIGGSQLQLNWFQLYPEKLDVIFPSSKEAIFDGINEVFIPIANRFIDYLSSRNCFANNRDNFRLSYISTRAAFSIVKTKDRYRFLSHIATVLLSIVYRAIDSYHFLTSLWQCSQRIGPFHLRFNLSSESFALEWI